MVWNQYVYEATTGNEIDYSDDEYENDQLELMHIDDWRDFYSSELEYMWNILRQYLYDANYPGHILIHETYEDFIRFCYRFSDA